MADTSGGALGIFGGIGYRDGMQRFPEKRIGADPAGEGARALEPALEWYAAYKKFWRNDPDAVKIVTAGRQWLLRMLASTLTLEDAVDPVTPGRTKRSP